jgi:hypothetical protein
MEFDFIFCLSPQLLLKEIENKKLRKQDQGGNGDGALQCCNVVMKSARCVQFDFFFEVFIEGQRTKAKKQKQKWESK